MRNGVKEMIKYGLVGGVGLLVEWGFFFLFRDVMGIPYWIAHAMGCFLAICNNFTLNYYFTFKARDRFFRRAMYFFGIGLIGIFVGTSLLPILVSICNSIFEGTGFVEHQKMVQNVAKLITTGFIAFVQFFLNKYLTFRMKQDKAAVE